MKNLRNKIKNMAGITLVALVITIIILLILAGVTIGIAMNGNGLFEKAKLATEKYNNEVQKEETEFTKYSNEIDSYVDGNRDYKPINYLTTEQDTGMKWIDGKAVYQKVITNLNLNGTWADASHLSGGNWYTIYCNVPTGLLDNVDTIINLRGVGDNKYSASLTYDGARLAYTGTTYGTIRTIIMEYTKTAN